VAPRAIWKGSIAFGLVDIPVAMLAAEASDDLDFDLVDRRDMAPIGYRKVNKETGAEVEAKDNLRVIEAGDGTLVPLTDAEIARAHPVSTHTIDVREFVDPADIPPMSFQRPYWLQPQKRALKSYALLRDVMQRTGKVAVATVVLRTRQYLAALLPQDGVLVLELLRYAHELRAAPEIEDGAGPTRAEVKVAELLVESMAGEFDHAKYADEYRDKILRLVEQKARTGKVKVAEEPPERPKGKVIDLMALLRQSVAATEGKGGRKRRKPAARRKAPARRKSG